MNSRVAAVLSVALNVSLLVLALRPRPAEQPGAAPVAPPETRARRAAELPARTVTDTREVILPGGVIPLDWSKVESPDYKEYIARLRGIRCPEETVRDIVIADINKLYAAKWRALMAPEGEVKYWQAWDSRELYVNPEIASRRREMDTERRALIKELLGVDPDQESRKLELRWVNQDRDDALLEYLPPDKREAIMALRLHERQRQREVSDRAGGKLRPEDRDELNKLHSRTLNQIKELFTQEEYDNFMMRVSDTATKVRAALTGFDPSEEEYKAIYWAQIELNANFHGTTRDPRDPEYLAMRAEKQPIMDARVRKALGDERYAEYARVRDPQFQEVYRFAQESDLPREVAAKAYDIRKIAEAQSARLRADSGLDPARRQEALQAIQAETQKTLDGLMGAETYQRYSRMRGTWVRSLGR